MPKNREQIAAEIGVSVSTLWRRMKEHNLKIPKGPVFPKDEEKLKALFGLELQVEGTADHENEKK